MTSRYLDSRYPRDNTALKGPGGEESRDGGRGTESMEERESEAGERRGKETDIKRETEDVGLGRRLAAAAAAPLDVRRVRNYRFSERLARSASRARFEESPGPFPRRAEPRALPGVPSA